MARRYSPRRNPGGDYVHHRLPAAGIFIRAYRGLLQENSSQNASVKEQVWVSRVCVLLITVLATILALSPNDTIFAIVKFAWGGFGAAFGPVVIMALYSRKTSWQSALMGMLAGFIVMIAWYFVGLGVYVYEILPGFIAGLVTIWIMNFFFPQDDEDILDEFDSVVKTLSGE